jgi:hypothetical protein
MTEHIDSFLRYVREMTSHRSDTDRPDYEMRDHLRGRFYREHVGFAPADEERVLREIRRGTGT